jgi:hypothetical protein
MKINLSYFHKLLIIQYDGLYEQLKFEKIMMLEIVSFISSIITILGVSGGIIKIIKKRKRYYHIALKKVKSLKAKDILQTRPYEPYYYKRSEDEKIKEYLLQKKIL